MRDSIHPPQGRPTAYHDAQDVELCSFRILVTAP